MKNQNQKSPETGIKKEVPEMADKKTMLPEEKARCKRRGASAGRGRGDHLLCDGQPK